MRHINRLPEPEILSQKHELWQQQFDERRRENPKLRPDNSKYGNPKIRKALDACSHYKCFYCESKLKGELKEIDHLKEVAIAPELAFTWTNLYLSCHNCNDKIDHNSIPVEDVLDPCSATDEEIQNNITFEDECICSQPGSDKGLKTIQKFHLNSDSLDLKRGKWLRKITDKALFIQRAMIEEGRKQMSASERQGLLLYVQHDQPYSLMSEIFLKKHFPELFA